MQYNGSESLPMVDRVVQVRRALQELGIDVRWNDDGPTCELNVPHNGTSLLFSRQFFAEPGRLLVTTVLMKPIAIEQIKSVEAQLSMLNSEPRIFLHDSVYLGSSVTLDAQPNEIDPIFMGRLLDQTTRRLLEVGELVGLLQKKT